MCLSRYYFNKFVGKPVRVSMCSQLVIKVTSTDETFGHFDAAV
jgi:hypothetical protein